MAMGEDEPTARRSWLDMLADMDDGAEDEEEGEAVAGNKEIEVGGLMPYEPPPAALPCLSKTPLQLLNGCLVLLQSGSPSTRSLLRMHLSRTFSRCLKS